MILSVTCSREMRDGDLNVCSSAIMSKPCREIIMAAVPTAISSRKISQLDIDNPLKERAAFRHPKYLDYIIISKIYFDEIWAVLSIC